jgi:hypothetical protein
MTTKTRRRESVLDNDPPPDDGARLEVTDDGHRWRADWLDDDRPHEALRRPLRFDG